MKRFARRFAPLVAGILLQTGGCMTDLRGVAADLASSITTALINDLVFSAFNLTA